MRDNYADMGFLHLGNTRRLAEFSVREAASCEARARGKCADRGMRHAYRCNLSANNSSFPVAPAFLRVGRACAKLEGEVGRRHRRHNGRLHRCFGERGHFAFLQKEF